MALKSSATVKPSIDLDSLTVQELTTLIRDTEAMRSSKQEEAKAALMNEMREKAEAIGLSFDSLFAHTATPSATRTRRGPSGTVAVKYRGPNGEEWSGRGRMPRWLQAMEAEGRKRQEFSV